MATSCGGEPQPSPAPTQSAAASAEPTPTAADAQLPDAAQAPGVDGPTDAIEGADEVAAAPAAPPPDLGAAEDPPTPEAAGEAAPEDPVKKPEATAKEVAEEAAAKLGPDKDRKKLSDEEMLELLDEDDLDQAEFEKAFGGKKKEGVKLPGAPSE